MPRKLEQILAQADDLAARFERHESESCELRGARALRTLRRAVLDRARAESEVARRVLLARDGGHSWQAIGPMLGTSGEATLQRHGGPARPGISTAFEPAKRGLVSPGADHFPTASAT